MHVDTRVIFLFLVQDTIHNYNNSRKCSKLNIYFRYNTFFDSQVVKCNQADRQTDGWFHLRRLSFVSCIIHVISMSVGEEGENFRKFSFKIQDTCNFLRNKYCISSPLVKGSRHEVGCNRFPVPKLRMSGAIIIIHIPHIGLHVVGRDSSYVH